ncbi:MAG TPA: hypothetical protein VK425_01405, partial [Acidimicrobiales bacterium]|nr:hypothetical protein [Acidimicrobiales bacterium]
MTLIGLIWRVFGISWAAVIPLFSLFYGATVALYYAVSRLLVGRILSTALSLALSISPVQLAMLTNFRDFSKAPFILAAILLGAMVARRRLSPRGLVSVSVLAGVVTGIGLGFRPDILETAPFFVVAVLISLAGRG